ncbi:biorientation of chromosomes in cell division protein 1-like 1 [Stylophora pistillata]|nr:biorientation of chromosomes in cell division protein 1-like 1 [Stylophora pistillata]
MSTDESRLSPKVEESLYKVKDEMNKTSRLKLASSSPGECLASLSSVEERGDKYMTSEGKNVNTKQSYPLSGVTETEAVKEDITRGIVVQADKENEANTQLNFKVKEEKVDAYGINEEGYISGKLIEEQRADNIVLDEGSKSAESTQSDSFQTAKADDKVPEFWSRFNEAPAMDVTVTAGEIKEDESVEKCEPMMLFSEKMSAAIGSESEERNPADSFKNIMNTVIISQSSLNDGEIDNASKEFSSETRSDASKVDTSSHEMRRQNLLEESPELLFTQKEGYNVLGDSNLAASSMVSLGVDSAQPSSMGEYSDGASDISEVSSVHTSDLSSFDDDDDEGEEAEETKKMTEKRELEDEGDTERESVFQSEQNSDSAPRRRSTRISSRRSTKEGESETSEGETTKEERTSSHKRRHGGKKRKPSSESKKVRSVSDVDKPRRRGRPRKDERRVSGQSVSQFRHSRMRYREDSGATTDRGESDSKESRSTRSQRQIKRTRCYSPSSEGTREVFLPRKRSRDDVNQLSSI